MHPDLLTSDLSETLMLTPFRKPPGGELLDWQKEFNTEVNSIRATIERVIANLKT